MAKFLLSTVGLPERTLELSAGLNRLGRNPTNDFRISDASVSSFHCEINVTGETVRIRDLASTNGTLVNGEPIEETTLHADQTVQLGSVKLVLKVDANESVHLPRVVIPDLNVSVPSARVPTHLADGTLACIEHRDMPARFKCGQCRQGFCENCVRVVGIAGGTSLIFCPSCDGPCESVRPPASAPVPVVPEKLSFLGRLTQTLHIRSKRTPTGQR